MEFGIDRGLSRLFAVGSCGYVPGLTSLDLRTGHATHLGSNGSSVCGERAVSLFGVLLIQQLRIPAPDASEPGSVI